MPNTGDEPIRLLSAAVDSLYWSARAQAKEGLEALLLRKAQAVVAGESVDIGSLEGFALSVLPHGAFRYPVVVDCHEFRIHVTDSTRLPTLWVQLRSSFIHEVGLQDALAASVRVAGGLLAGPIDAPHASRVDIYADFAAWHLLQSDRPGLVTHADLRAHFRAGTEEVETVQAGKSPLLVRIYRKDIEVRSRGGHAPVFWAGWDGPVTRVEVQVGSARLRDFGIATVDDALASLGDLWRYATANFVELRVPSAGPRESWAIRPEWRMVQAVGFVSFPHSGVVPRVVILGDRLRILRAIFGYLSALGAIDGESRLAVLLGRLPRHLGAVARGRLFEDEVARKRRRLPRAIREPSLDSEAASASPGKEAPWAPEPSQTDTRTDE